MKSTIGVELWSLQQLTMLRDMDLKQLVRVVADLGVKRIDLMDEYLPVWPHSNLLDLYDLKKLLSDHDLKLMTCWTAEYIVGELLTSTMEKTLKHFRYYASVISLLGGEYIVLPFDLNMPTVNHQQAADMFEDFCRKAIPICQETNVKIAINPSRQYNPPYAIKLCRSVASPWITMAPDLEAWRLKTDDLPLVHAELPGAPEAEPLPVSMFEECLPYSPIVHFKLMGFDENGEDPHFPVKEIMQAVNSSPIDHHLVIEYEGWIPDMNPHLDPIERTRMAIELIKRYQN